MLSLTCQKFTHFIKFITLLLGDRGIEMDYIVLFFLLILTTTQTMSFHHHCNSGVYSLASGMGELQLLTTLQYCLIDNCTIIRNDTGQQLDIVYTSQSHLVVTPTDGQTSTILIFKNEPELFCSTLNASDHGTNTLQVIELISLLLFALEGGYIAVVHMIFKEIRGTFGKLLMLTNIILVFQCVNAFALSITHFNILVDSIIPCYLFNFLFMQLMVVGETFTTSSLAYLALLVRYSYKSIEMTKYFNNRLYKYGITYVLGLSVLFGFFVVTYDFGTGTYRHALLPNGHCSHLAQSEYDTKRLLHAYNYVNAIAQAIILTTYFVYFYKLSKVLKGVKKMASKKDTQLNKFFFKIALTMAATLGISEILFALSWNFDNQLGIRIAGLFYFIQQFVIMSLYMCSKKMRRLWKQKLCNTEITS